MILQPTPKFLKDIKALQKIFTGKNFDAAKLRKQAWERK